MIRLILFVVFIHFLFLSLLKREKQQPLTLQASKHPHGNSPTAGIHPQTTQPRPLRYGNDNTSVNRQSRTQTTRPDPIPGQLELHSFIDYYSSYYGIYSYLHVCLFFCFFVDFFNNWYQTFCRFSFSLNAKPQKNK